MEILIKNIKLTRGDSWGQQIEIETSITDINEIKFAVKNRLDDVKIEKKIGDGITFEDNIITIQLKPSDTDDLKEEEQYAYGIKIYYGIDDELTIVKGSFDPSWKAID